MKTKMIIKWAAAVTLACVTIATAGAQTMPVTEKLIDETKGTWSTLAGNVTFSGNSFDITSGWGNQAYGAFGKTINLSTLSVGESISLSFNLTASSFNDSGNRFFSFGFIDTAGAGLSTVYVAEQVNAANASFRAMANALMIYNDGQLGNSGITGFDLTDKLEHTVSFAVAVDGKNAQDKNTYTLTLIVDGGSPIATKTGVLLPKGETISGISLLGHNTISFNVNSIYVDYTTLQAVPEPSAFALLGVGAGLLAFLRRRK